MATQRSRKYPESNPLTLAILFDKQMSTYTLEILPPRSNWSNSVSFVKIIIAPGLLDRTATKTANRSGGASKAFL
jgi:hypothetical protein